MCRPLGLAGLITATVATVTANAAPANEPERLIQRGLDLRRKGQDFEAVELFQKAYDLAPTPRSCAQLGLAEQATARWAEAEEHLDKALAAVNHAWIRKNRVVLESSLATVRARVGQIDLRGEPPGSELLVNGRPRGRLPLAAPVRVSEGQVELELRNPGYTSMTRTLNLAGGQILHLYMGLASTAAQGIQTPSNKTGPAAGIVETSGALPATPPGRPYRITAIAAGVVALAGAGFGLWQGVRVERFQKDYERAATNTDRESFRKDGERAETLQWVGYGVGAAAAAGSAVIWYLGIRADRSGSSAMSETLWRPLLLPHGTGVGAIGRF